MVIYHVNGQTLCDQKLKISGTSSPSCLYQSRKHQSRAGRGRSPAEGSCQWHLHISLPGCTGAVQTDWYFLCFLSTFPSPPVMWQLPSINFLKKQYHKKPEQCQKLHLGFEFLCHPLVPNVLLSPCLLANLKTGISKVLVTHAKWFQILNQVFANKKAVYFHHFSVLNTDSTRANSLMSNCYSLQSQHVPSVKPVRAIQNNPPHNITINYFCNNVLLDCTCAVLFLSSLQMTPKEKNNSKHVQLSNPFWWSLRFTF